VVHFLIVLYTHPPSDPLGKKPNGDEKMNCEDDDYGDKPFTYCGKKNCESCGGE